MEKQNQSHIDSIKRINLITFVIACMVLMALSVHMAVAENRSSMSQMDGNYSVSINPKSTLTLHFDTSSYESAVP